MNVDFKRAAFAGVLCLTLAGAVGASAQDRQPGPPGRNAGQRAAERQKMFEEFKQRREMRLHDLLQIKPAQEGAFKAYLAAIEPAPKDHPMPAPGAMPKPLTTPERLDRAAQRIAEMQKRLAATRTFYAGLSPEQQKAFDELGPMGGRGGHGHHGFGGHGGWGGHRGPGGPGGPDGFQGPPPR